jgi:hypothetical protein
MQHHKFPTAFAILISLLCGCKATQYSHSVNGENLDLTVVEKADAINFASFRKQNTPTLTERSNLSREASRALPLMNVAFSLATNVIKKIIVKERKKYISSYSFGLTDLYFYDQLSTQGVFDPVGMQFSGFRLLRTFVNKEGQTDTAFFAHFVLDTTNPEEIINNSYFRLRLRELQLNYTKAKMTSGQKKTVNMDIDISFTTSYTSEMGQLHDNIELGKFHLLLRNAPIDRSVPGYNAFYKNLENKPVLGKSFIVPRSFGYHMTSQNQISRSFSQGAYSITVEVKESTKDKFVTALLVDNSSKIIDAAGEKAKGLFTAPAKKPVAK